MLTAVTGINWGDEGKGRVIDLLAEQADVVVRYQGGNNAGHTVVTDQGKFVLNLLPSGILHPGVVCVLGDGMVVDLEHLSREMDELDSFVPVVEMLPGWECDISGCRTYEELPENAKAYIRILEQLLNHEIQFISVGARRNQFLTKAWL